MTSHHDDHPPTILAPVAEPTELRRRLRRHAEEEPARTLAELTRPDELAAHLWAAWTRPLERRGVDPQELTDCIGACDREIWYWIWGHRTWAHLTQTFTGRIVRHH